MPHTDYERGEIGCLRDPTNLKGFTEMQQISRGPPRCNQSQGVFRNATALKDSVILKVTDVQLQEIQSNDNSASIG